ncbi:MAG: DUF1638 domain-containing protein [Desulfacinum sp.]|jgi:hypothetical protein|nr:DUF1638 domain-containing protein [Desulfacinum sp.]MBZ4658840.1 hypothetical protein [Desulfacinum sp.]
MKTVVACRIFEDELRACLRERDDVKIHWVDAALHANLDRLEKDIRNRLEALSVQGGARFLFFGAGCHPELGKIADEYGFEAAPFRNCLEWLAGPEAREMERDRTMLMTPAWVRVWPQIMAVMGWDQVDARIQLGRYDRILVLDAGLHSLSDEEILNFFDLVQVPLMIEPVDVRDFCARIREFIG